MAVLPTATVEAELEGTTRLSVSHRIQCYSSSWARKDWFIQYLVFMMIQGVSLTLVN